MSLNEVRPISIDSKRYPSCELELHNTYNSYFVKKEFISAGDRSEYRFFASSNAQFVHNENAGSLENIYHDQLAYARCRESMLIFVGVEDGKNEQNPVNARRCGIGSYLTLMCFVDPQVNPGDDRMTYLNLKQKFEDNNAIIQRVGTTCNKLIYLDASVEDNRERFTYFSAAIKAGYDRIVLQKRGRNAWEMKKILEAKSEYTDNAGNFMQKYEDGWFFCRTCVGYVSS